MTFDLLLDLILPRDCAGCAAPGHLWCPTCAESVDALWQIERTALTGPPAYALAPYADAARRLVIAYKDRGRRELAPAMGQAMANGLRRLSGRIPWPDRLCLVPAPSRAAAARRRGGNHIARAAAHAARDLAARGTAVTLAPAITVAARTRDQVGLARAERTANLRGALALRRQATPPAATPVILLDDVVTTGATAAACVDVLAKAGIPVIAVLAFSATI